jgi:hypothetical protein
MSCICCAHFYTNNFKEEAGNCCLYPEHIVVSTEHYCGQIVMKSTWSTEIKSISPIRDAQKDRNKYADMYHKERDARFLLEKKIKALKSDLKTKSAKIPLVHL